MFQNSLLPSFTLLAHSQHSCTIKLINLPMWKAKCDVFIVPTYDFNIWPWFTLSYLFHVAAWLSLFERGSLDRQNVIFTLFNLFITLETSWLCFSSSNPPWLWWDEDGDNASKWTSDPGVPGWQWPSSWHRVVQGWGQTAGTGSEEIKIGTGQRITVLWLTLGLFILPPRLFHQLGGRIQRLARGQYLEIQEIRPEDSGHYSCVVTNMAGRTSLFFTVEIICKSACQ